MNRAVLTTWKTVGECFPYIKNGANIKQDKTKRGIPITRIETLSGNRFNRDRMGYADIHDVKPYANWILQNGDILMSHINSLPYIGRAVEYKAKENETIIHGMNLLLLRACSTMILPEYACLYFNTAVFKKQILRITKKAVNQASFSIKDLKAILIPLPPLEIQAEIAQQFAQLQTTIDLNLRTIEKLDALAKSRFIEMFGDPIENPKGWRSSSLKEVAPAKGDPVPDKGTVWSLGLDAVEAGTGIILRKDIAKADSLKSSNIGFSARHVLYSKLRPYLNKVVLPEEIGVCTTELLPLLPNQSELNRVYLCYLLRSDSFVSFISGHTNGAKMPRADMNTLNSFGVSIPPLALQQEFTNFVSQVDKLRFEAQQQIEKLETLKKSLMQEYFN